MRKIYAMLLICACTASAFAEQAIPDPEAWYRDGYAPLWEADPAGNTQALTGFYATSVESHMAGGEVRSVTAHEFVAAPIEGWLAEGWLNSKLQDLQVERINATTTSFKASWVDRNDGAPDTLSCGWYLADYMEGTWKFSAYAELDCAAHGFQLHGG